LESNAQCTLMLTARRLGSVRSHLSLELQL
jgi:hypothetical protein